MPHQRGPDFTATQSIRRNENIPVRRESDGEDGGLVVRDPPHQLPGADVPQADLLVVPGRGQEGAVRAEGGDPDGGGAGLDEGRHHLRRPHVPDDARPVRGAGAEQGGAGRELGAVDAVLVSWQREVGQALQPASVRCFYLTES